MIRKFVCVADVEEAYEEGAIGWDVRCAAIHNFASQPPPSHVLIIGSKDRMKVEAGKQAQLTINGKVPFMFAGDL